MWIYFFATIGFIATLLKFLKTLNALAQIAITLIIPYFSAETSQTLVEKYGSWALITGCTDGLGKQYAKELARRGLNLVLVSRNEDKLKSTVKEIESLYSVETQIIVADFSDPQNAVRIVKDKLKDWPPVGILVNNVGKMFEYPMSFGEVPEQDLWDVMRINVEATTMMTKLLINEMVERRKGAIVNISSGSSFQPLPLMSIYAASKTYINNFTDALREEYYNYGLTIQLVTPLFVSTKMSNFVNDFKNNIFLAPNAEAYVKSAINTLGTFDNTTGYWAHEIQYFIMSLCPIKFRMQIGKWINSYFSQGYKQQL